MPRTSSSVARLLRDGEHEPDDDEQPRGKGGDQGVELRMDADVARGVDADARTWILFGELAGQPSSERRHRRLRAATVTPRLQPP